MSSWERLECSDSQDSCKQIAEKLHMLYFNFPNIILNFGIDGLNRGNVFAK